MVAAVERGFPQREIQEAAFQFQQAVERKDKIIVGVNEYVMDEKPHPDPVHRRDGGGGADGARAARSRRRATTSASSRPCADLQEAARGTDNLMYPILEAPRAYATLGEMCDALREVWGEYEEAPDFLITRS